MEDEAAWARSIAGGDRAAFERFVDAFGPRLHRLARRYASSECDAEDLTQEIFVALFQSVGSFGSRSALSTWVYRVALNHCLRHREQARRRPEASAATSTSSTCTSQNEEPEAAGDREADPARQAARREMRLEQLSDGHRDVVVLHELHGLTYGECAQALGIPLGTVKSRLFNALRHLRVHLGPYVLGDHQDQQAQAHNAASAAKAAASKSPSRGEAP